MSKPRRKKRLPKRVLALPDLEQSKTAVLNSLTSKSGQRAYDRAITDFDFQVVVSKAREHTVLVQAHCPSRFRYNPNTCRSLSAKAETHLPGKHVLRFPRIPNAQTFETRRTGTMRRKMDRQAADEDGGRRDENRRACFIFLSITS